MHFKFGCLLSAMLLATPLYPPLQANQSDPKATSSFDPFTGKITRNKVRLRLQPHLDGQILRELAKDDLLVIKGEEDEFYAAEPPKDTKGYVFRTYVLDNVVEGNHVNVRLEPDIESPVIAQLNTGDAVDGIVSPLNSKWLEITPPSSARFFVCKEYIEKIGDASVLSTVGRRREEVNSLLNAAQRHSQAELQKPFEEINLDDAFSKLNEISKLYADFPDQVTRAKEMLARIQESYTQKKIAYLEAKTLLLGHAIEQSELSLQMKSQQEQLSQLEKALESAPIYSGIPTQTFEPPQAAGKTDVATGEEPFDWNLTFETDDKSDREKVWIAIEKNLYNNGVAQHDPFHVNDYYNQQAQDAVVVRGTIESYPRSVKSKPGDYILVSKGTNLPVAYLYSTRVNLKDYIGKEITMKVSPRPNNYFAFPAYFVLSLE